MEFNPPERLFELEESATLKASEKANAMIASGIKVYKLDVGEPDFKTPKKIIEAAYSAMNNGMTHYAPSLGVAQFRQAISSKYSVKPENVIATPGSKQGIYYALFSILNPGDEVIIINPAWPSYKQIVKLVGGVPREVNANEQFIPDIDEVESAVGNKTKAILVNSPNNPTGAVYSKSTIRGIAEIAHDHNLWVISDEIYDRMVYDTEYVSFLNVMGIEDGLILLNGFSKAYAMTGWRLGYTIGTKEVVKQMAKIQGHTATSPVTFAQIAAITAINECEDDVKAMVSEFGRRRAKVISMLNQKGLKFTVPSGAFYFFIDLGRYIGKGVDPASYLLENAHVSTTSGAAFGDKYPAFVRISYATSNETIENGFGKIFETLKV
ncbi:MAG: pyridoxal phosphate-dependent aminotransferase [Nitrososphaerota archaeon]|jgi:aspartate aminotransferase|nr:pyridoxal phosphate-dependent aminotransferase [Nitrososphaerota archaeon]MDG6927089.1 pyridoxal phosphate-dependent aminotransferase [Nitrososphaerota archaeon]MDG6929888.1 pyridoxal phosphate-dependent aminotransferase [Nitrososphaerota archaeon]MDG6932344.1 pyridoxal phosphate-dependent aminotransferase [Nitrososphaerota archaeon]MDG6935903.1 pyridoxal phosphate-dependent aminotransferase [Nitrososphaerota archaeon]